MAKSFLPATGTVSVTKGYSKGVFFMLSEKEVKQEYQRKADIAADNVKHAINKPLAVHTFLRYLFLSI